MLYHAALKQALFCPRNRDQGRVGPSPAGVGVGDAWSPPAVEWGSSGAGSTGTAGGREEGREGTARPQVGEIGKGLRLGQVGWCWGLKGQGQGEQGRSVRVWAGSGLWSRLAGAGFASGDGAGAAHPSRRCWRAQLGATTAVTCAAGVSGAPFLGTTRLQHPVRDLPRADILRWKEE